MWYLQYVSAFLFYRIGEIWGPLPMFSSIIYFSINSSSTMPPFGGMPSRIASTMRRPRFRGVAGAPEFLRQLSLRPDPQGPIEDEPDEFQTVSFATLRTGTITKDMHDAARDFQAQFTIARFDVVRCMPLVRLPGGGGAGDTDAQVDGRRRVGKALRSAGSAARPAAVGLGRRCQLGDRRLPWWAAAGIRPV